LVSCRWSDMCAACEGKATVRVILTTKRGDDLKAKRMLMLKHHNKFLLLYISQQGPRTICILSANGVISSVTLREPDSSGGALTYEILSLAGSFILSENGGIRNISGGIRVSLSSPDRRVVDGSIAGLLVAANPVQIIVGSFLTGVHQEQKSGQNPKLDNTTITIPTNAAVPFSVPDSLAVPIPLQTLAPASARAPETNESYFAKQNLTSPTFRGDNWSSYNAPESRNKP
ncbi:AT-hook motif nuclear-localized protein 1-like protein, partial [Tanacetum coccineum]